MIKLKLLIWN